MKLFILFICLLKCFPAVAFDGFRDTTTYNEPAMSLHDLKQMSVPDFKINTLVLDYLGTYDLQFNDIDKGKWNTSFADNKHIELVMSVALDIPKDVEVKLEQVDSTEYIMTSSEPVKISMAYGVYQSKFTEIRFQFNKGYMRIVESNITGYLGEFLGRSEGWQI